MIGIIGAGLSGLSAANQLSKKKIPFLLLEKSNSVGGRVKSDYENGFIFDHGFQVLLTSYPQIESKVSLDKINIKSFLPGAIIYTGTGKSIEVADPLRMPYKLVKTLFAPIGSLLDKVKILTLRYVKSNSNDTSADFLKNFGFSDKIITLFFKPFFSGVFLEKNLETKSNYFIFLFKMFAKGLASLPEKGMQALPDYLATELKESILLNHTVIEISEGSNGVLVKTNKGDYNFDKIILALDSKSSNKLYPMSRELDDFRSVVTYYFESPKINNLQQYLILNGSGVGNINHIAFLSHIQPSYSPTDKDLISVNVITGNFNISEAEILSEIADYKLFDVSKWVFLKSYKVPNALPKVFNYKDKSSEKIILAGDYLATPSINGAMFSGEQAADKI